MTRGLRVSFRKCPGGKFIILNVLKSGLYDGFSEKMMKISVFRALKPKFGQCIELIVGFRTDAAGIPTRLIRDCVACGILVRK